MTNPDTDHYYADRLHHREVYQEHLLVDEDEEADEHDALEDDSDGGDY